CRRVGGGQRVDGLAPRKHGFGHLGRDEDGRGGHHSPAGPEPRTNASESAFALAPPEKPPSTGISAPLMKLDPSDMRKTISAATSTTCPTRLCGFSEPLSSAHVGGTH